MRHNRMFFLVVFLVVGVSLQYCSESITDSPVSSVMDYSLAKKGIDELKTTGGVEFVWMGGNGKKSPDEDKRAFAEFNAHQEYVEGPVKGQFTFRVTSLDLIPHREIIQGR